MKKYIVREGDTMWNISKATGVRLNLLMAANPQISDPNQLKPGSVVVIPELHKGNTHGGTAPGMTQPPSTAPTPSTVQPSGPVQPPAAPETPGHVYPHAAASASHGPSVPGMPSYFGFVWPHVVKANETWSTIAEDYKLDMALLQQMNPMHAGTHLKEGDILYIPGKQAMAKPEVGPSTIGSHAAPVPPVQMPYTDVMPVPQAPPYSTTGPQPYEGPHTHQPYREPSYDNPQYSVPNIPPGMWAFIPAPAPNARGAHFPYPAMMPYFQVPATWYRDMDDSSSWDASWSTSTTYRGESPSNFHESRASEWFGDAGDDYRPD